MAMPKKFDEESTVISFRVPVSAKQKIVEKITKIIAKYLKK